jgi:signal transduction histidine kinase
VAQRFPAGLPRLRGDNRAMRQVAINLLSNAIKFTPPGGAVMVTAELNTTSLAITVTDTGVGLAPQDIERVFTPYVQVGNPMVRRDDGVGLGLALVRTLVELHDGRVAIESTPGEGTRVILTFPRNRLIEPGMADEAARADIGLSV